MKKALPSTLLKIKFHRCDRSFWAHFDKYRSKRTSPWTSTGDAADAILSIVVGNGLFEGEVVDVKAGSVVAEV